MRVQSKAALTLAFITPLITEVLTGNTPVTRFFLPQYFILLTIAYLPALLIREVAVKWRLNLTGAAILGIAYGIYNEGICAQTLLKTDVPVPTFNNYGFLWGINFSWAAVILTWHMLYSVLFPIAIANFLYPRVSNESWLSKKTTVVLLFLVCLLGEFCFFSLGKYPPIYSVIFSGLIILSGWLSRFFTFSPEEHNPRAAFSYKPVLSGFTCGLVFIGSFILSALKVPLIFFYLYWAGSFSLFTVFLKRMGWLKFPGFLLFGLGSYIVFTLLSIGGNGAPRVVLLYTAAVFVTFFTILLLKVRAAYIK